jgi:hypothetical protein
MADNKTYRDIELDYKDVDVEELHKELSAQLGDKFYGVSTATIGDKEIIYAHVALDVRGVDVSKVHATYLAHDKSKLPPKPVRKSFEERLDEMANEIAELKARNANLEAQAATPKK